MAFFEYTPLQWQVCFPKQLLLLSGQLRADVTEYSNIALSQTPLMKEAWPRHPSVMSAQSCGSFWEIGTPSEQCCYLFPTESLPFHHVFFSFNLWQVLIKKKKGSRATTEYGCSPAALIPDPQHAAPFLRQASPVLPSLSRNNKEHVYCIGWI